MSDKTLRFELAGCTATLLREIAEPACTRKDVAKTYALAMRSTEPTDWKAVNKAILDRWGTSGLTRVKKMAWSGSCWEGLP